jgi:hypothetical protein
MKEVIVRAWCDGDFAPHDDPVEATVEHIVVVEGRQYILDVCDACDTTLTETTERWATVGTLRNPEKPARRRPPSRDDGTPESYRTCPVCHIVSVSRGALGQHLYQKHDKKLTEFEWEYNPRKAG